MNRAPRTGDDQIRWQRQAAALLGRLLELAAREGLPPVAWTVQTAGGSVAGQVLSHPDAQRREHLNAWKAATTAASGKVPDHDHEHTSGGRETRLNRVVAAPSSKPGARRQDVAERGRGPGGQHLADEEAE